MKKIYYLGTCSTCGKIMAAANITEAAGFEMQDIKTEPITKAQAEQMKKIAGSYQALFSKRALLYKRLGLKDKNLSEADYKKYILEHYTFLKRPVVIIGNQIFIGSEKKNVEALKAATGG